ncbi:MAG: hypothetical protein AAGI03_10360 [Pseudomonadota bacterium]
MDEYTGNIVSDLFGEECDFDDPEAFWVAQITAIATRKEAYLADGWTEVIVLEPGTYFPAYDYIDTAKEDGGKVYVTIAHNGEVTFYEGLLSRKDLKARQRAEAG